VDRLKFMLKGTPAMTTLIPEIHNPKSNPSPQVAVRAGRWLVPLITAAMLAGALPLSAQGLPAANEAQLLATLKSDAPRKDKSDACIVLARVATKEAVPVLAPLLADAEFNHMARYALETIADPSADAALLEAAGKLNGLQLAGVISSLGVRRTPKADQVLPGFLMHPDPAVVEAAARALGNLATPVAIRSLQAALTKVPARQQTAVSEGLLRAAEALLAQGKPGEATVIFDQLRPLTTVPSHVRAGALRGAIIARGSAGVPLLAEGLRSDDFVLVDAAIRTALEVPGADVTAVLVAQMPQLSADHRILILQTLAQRQDPAALSALSTAARSGDLNVRIVAVRGLTQLGNPAGSPGAGRIAHRPGAGHQSGRAGRTVHPARRRGRRSCGGAAKR
jgi:HEAT repeat protein